MIATICARGGSKGLPGKNMRPFAGVPLIVHTIRQAKVAKCVDAVYVSTDDEDIAAASQANGATVIRRPAHLATDNAPKLKALEHLIGCIEADGMVVERFVDLQPTSPLRTPKDIENAIWIGGDVVVSVSEARDNPYFNLCELTYHGLRPSKESAARNRQDAPTVLALNGSIYVWKREALRRAAKEGLWSVSVSPYVMKRCVDIDTLEDFEYAEWLYRREN